MADPKEIQYWLETFATMAREIMDKHPDGPGVGFVQCQIALLAMKDVREVEQNPNAWLH